jgi:hypothetical protein
MYRLLVPEGLLVSWDPLAHNPVINVYRWIARAVRTPGEHPLRIEQLSLFKGCFREVRWKTFWCCSLLVFLRFFLWEWVSPSKVRYWKKIITDAERLRSFYLPLERIDTALLARFPLLERYCWNIVVICKK